MAQTNINIRMDEDKAVREHGLPFQVSVDPFYTDTNQTRIREAVERLNAGLGTEHELIEVDE